jgi:hypothetical protein
VYPTGKDYDEERLNAINGYRFLRTPENKVLRFPHFPGFPGFFKVCDGFLCKTLQVG